MDVDVKATCEQCEAPLDETDKYCPDCGEAVPLLPFHEETAEQLPTFDWPTPDLERLRSRRTLIIGGVALAVLTALIWAGTRASATQRQYDKSAQVLMSTIGELSTAQSAQDVRDGAQSAAAELPSIETALAKDPDSSDAARLISMRTAFVYLSDQRGFQDSDTSVWTTERVPLQNTLEDLSDNGGSTAAAAEAGRNMARHLDELSHEIADGPAR